VTERECRERLARNVRRLARRKRMSIEHLADFAEISRATLWRLLACMHNPTLRTLVKLANALECSPKDLLDGA
jgi:transcriptional regulator with XRE-family HTH domain